MLFCRHEQQSMATTSIMLGKGGWGGGEMSVGKTSSLKLSGSSGVVPVPVCRPTRCTVSFTVALAVACFSTSSRTTSAASPTCSCSCTSSVRCARGACTASRSPTPTTRTFTSLSEVRRSLCVEREPPRVITAYISYSSRFAVATYHVKRRTRT